jgi:coenzyme PQQ biosynthesis protein PqqD
MIDRASRPRLATRARLHYDRHTDRHMLLYPEKGLALNATALAILQLCDGALDVSGIAQRLRDGLKHTPLERIEDDVLAFLTDLHQRGLIREEPE